MSRNKLVPRPIHLKLEMNFQPRGVNDPSHDKFEGAIPEFVADDIIRAVFSKWDQREIADALTREAQDLGLYDGELDPEVRRILHENAWELYEDHPGPQEKCCSSCGCRPCMCPDISKCPGCLQEADNGHDREVPPNPYYCSKCIGQEWVCKEPDKSTCGGPLNPKANWKASKGDV